MLAGVTLYAGAPFHWFGHDYATDDPIDTTGWDDHAIRQLLINAPVYSSGTAGGSANINDTGSWQADHAYAKDDIFEQAGSTYHVIVAYISGTSFGSTDTANTTVWAQVGAQGATGAQGPAGAQGTAGRTVWSGNGTPSDSLGAQDDFYIDLTTDIMYGPKGSATWGTRGAAATFIQATSGTGNPSTITVPALAATGDLLILAKETNGTNAGNPNGSGAGAGWTELTTPTAEVRIFYKTCTATDPGATVTLANTSGSDGGWVCSAYRNADSTPTPNAIIAGASTESLVAQEANDVVVSVFFQLNWNGAQAASPAGTTQRARPTTGFCVMCFDDETKAAAGATTVRTTGGDGTHYSGSLIVRPALTAQHVSLVGVTGATGATGATGPAGPQWNVIHKTAAYAAVANDLVLADATTAAFAVTAPAPAANVRFAVKKIDASANAVTINPHGTETFDGAANVPISAQWGDDTYESDGTNWFKV